MKTAHKAIFTLTAFSMIERVMGFVFKVYLSVEMGATTLGVYQVALSFFFVLLSLTTSGLPLVTGKLTAAYSVTGKKQKVNSVVSAGLLINTIISLVLCAVVLIFQNIFKSFLASEGSLYVLLLLLPALVFGSMGAAFRGNLWGQEKYFAVSLIELIEQIARIVICVALFLLGFGKLEAAAMSLIIATLLNALLCFIFFLKYGGKVSSPKGELVPLMKTSAPISGVKASTNVVNSIMAVIIPLLFVSSGLTNDQSLAYYGSCIGMALPLMYLPITIVGSLAYTLIPSLSKAVATGDTKAVKRQVDTAIKFSVVAAALFIPVFYALGDALGTYIFKSAEAGQFLKLGGILLIPISLESIISSMMNSLGLEFRGLINYLIGSAVMFGVMFIFYGNFSIDVLFWSLFTSLTLSTIIDLYSVKKKTGASLGFIKTIGLSVLLAFPCISICNWCYNLFAFMPEILKIICAGAIGTIGYGLLAFVFELVDISAFLSSRKKRGERAPAQLNKAKANSKTQCNSNDKKRGKRQSKGLQKKGQNSIIRT